MSPGLSRRIDWRFTPEASLRHGLLSEPAVFPLERRTPLDTTPVSIPCPRHKDGIGLHGAPSLTISRSILADMRFRPVAAPPLLPQEFEEEPGGLLLPLKMMDQHLAAGTDPAPSTDQAGLAEQVRLDRHSVIPRHVLLGVDAFDIKLVRLRNHDTEN